MSIGFHNYAEARRLLLAVYAKRRERGQDAEGQSFFAQPELDIMSHDGGAWVADELARIERATELDMPGFDLDGLAADIIQRADERKGEG